MNFPLSLRIAALASLVGFLPADGQGLRDQAMIDSAARWEPDIAAFEAADRESPPPKHASVFAGSSSFRMWTSLAEAFPEREVINRGFGGSQMSDLLVFADRIVLAYEPAEIFVYEGDNDLPAGKSPETIRQQFRAFVELVRSRLSDTPIYFVSIKPSPARIDWLEAAATANRLIADYCAATEGAEFIDVYTAMLDDSGQPRGDIFIKDRLHMNAKGYAIWTDMIRRHLAKESK